MTDDDTNDYGLKYVLLLLPLLLLFLKGRVGTTTFDNSVVWIIFIYLAMLIIYMANNEGKAQSPQVIGDNFHFSTSVRDIHPIGDWVILYNGIDWAFRLDFKDRVVVAHKDAVEKVGDNYLVRSLCYRKRFYDLTPDVQKYFWTNKLSRKHILYGTYDRAILGKNPNLFFYEDTISRLSDENTANRNYAQAKMGDLDDLMVKLSQWSNAGTKKSLLQAFVDNVSKPSKKKDEDE